MPIIRDDFSKYKYDDTEISTYMNMKGIRDIPEGKALVEIDTDEIEEFLNMNPNEFERIKCPDRISKGKVKEYCKKFFEGFFGVNFDFEVKHGYNSSFIKKHIIKKPKMSVFKVPVKYTRKTNGRALQAGDCIPRTYRIEQIELNSNRTYSTISTYVHEITHPLIERNSDKERGKNPSYTNYANMEVASMFMEKVAFDELIKREENPATREKLERAKKIRNLNRFIETVNGTKEMVVMIDSKNNALAAQGNDPSLKDIKPQDYYTKFPAFGSRNIKLEDRTPNPTIEEKILSFLSGEKVHNKKQPSILESNIADNYVHTIGGLYSYALYREYRRGNSEKIKRDMTQCLLGEKTIEEVLSENGIKGITKEIIHDYVEESRRSKEELENPDKGNFER